MAPKAQSPVATVASPSAFQVLIDRRPWQVCKGFSSFLLFEFGRVRRRSDGSRHGTYTLWIYMADWRAQKDGRELAHSESSDHAIHQAAQAFVGQKLKSILLHTCMVKRKLRHGATFHFEGGLRLRAWMYDRGEPSTVFMLYTPNLLIGYDYDGQTRKTPIDRDTWQAPTEPSVSARRTQRPG